MQSIGSVERFAYRTSKYIVYKKKELNVTK